MNIRLFIGVCAVFLVLSGAGHAAPPEVPIGPDFEGLGISVTSGGQIVVFAGIRNIGGKVGVCGVVWFEDVTATTRSLERQFTEQVGFSIAGKPLSVSTGAFKRYTDVDEAKDTGIARCATTRRA